MKTVVLPNEELNRLGLEAAELKNQLQLQKNLYDEAKVAYQRDRTIRLQEFELKERDF